MGSQAFLAKKNQLARSRVSPALRWHDAAEARLFHDLVTFEFAGTIGHQTRISNGYTVHRQGIDYVKIKCATKDNMENMRTFCACNVWIYILSALLALSHM